MSFPFEGLRKRFLTFKRAFAFSLGIFLKSPAKSEIFIENIILSTKILQQNAFHISNAYSFLKNN